MAGRFVLLLFIVRTLNQVCLLRSTGGRQSSLNHTGVRAMSTLICSQIIFRHGSRTPLFTLNDRVQEACSEKGGSDDPLGYQNVFYDPDKILTPYEKTKDVKVHVNKLKGDEFTNSISDWWAQQGRNLDARLPGGADIGVLTRLGNEQLFELGQRIFNKIEHEKEYIEKLRQYASYKIRSTYFERTIHSAKNFMSGFLHELHDRVPEKLEIDVDDIFEECLFPNAHFTHCLNRSVSEFYEELPSHHPFQQCKQKFLDLMGIREYEYGLLELSDEPSTRIPLGLPLSPALKDLYEEANSHLSEELIAIYKGRLDEADFIKLAIGRVLHLFKTNFEKAIEDGNKTDHPNFYAFAAHDNTLSILSLALDFYAKRWPWFGSFLMLQLFKEHGTFFVRLTYDDDTRRSSDWRTNNQTIEAVSELKLDEFYDLMDKYALNDAETKALDQKLNHKFYGAPALTSK